MEGVPQKGCLLLQQALKVLGVLSKQVAVLTLAPVLEGVVDSVELAAGALVLADAARLPWEPW